MILFNKTHSVDSFGNTGQIRLFDNNSNNSNKNINNANNCNNNNNNIYLTIYVLWTGTKICTVLKPKQLFLV